MSCCQQCNQSGLGALASFYGLRGLGQIPQQLPAIAGGAPFQFGYNVGYLGGQKLYEPEEIARVLDDLALSYDTRSYHVAGYLNPYLTIEGNAVTTWQSASDFGQEIYQAVRDAGYPIDYSSIQFRFEPDPGSGQTAAPMVGTPHPTTDAQQTQTQTQTQNRSGQPSGKQECKWSQMEFGDYIACVLGIKGAVSGMTAGATGAILGVGVLAAVALVLMKR